MKRRPCSHRVSYAHVMRRIAVPLVMLALFIWSGPTVRLCAAPPQVVAVVNKMASLRVFRATVSFGTGGGMTSGVLSYQNGKTHFKLSDGRVVAGNGRNMVVYSPATGTAGKQSMVGGGGGLGWLLSGFEWRVGGNAATGKAVDPGAKVQEVQIVWGANNILRSLKVKRAGSEAPFRITLSNVRTAGGFPASLFSYKPPSGSRTVENPLDQRN
ncbi:MAG: outer membrane lipoprotein carrier protein LolA [Leptospiraceae bacterium]|nr:outer membrane lipoprotein carrier protein LolA [Leptospiraceae bacterium]